VQDALDKFEQLLVAATQALGPHHELILDSRSQHASLTGENGNIARAADLYKSLIVDRTAVQGQDHPATLNDREQLLQWCDDKISDAVD
jgi:CHASE1-domain containing sensor protein